MTSHALIKYDCYLETKPNSWAVIIDKQIHYFPFSLCDIDEKSKCIYCPEWLAIEKELEDYIEG